MIGAVTPGQGAVILAADVGRTTCRLARFDDGARSRAASSPCGWGLADRGGAHAIAAIIGRTAEALLDDGARPTTIGVGAAGAVHDRAAVRELGVALQRRFPDAEVIVSSDVVTAHVGALMGEPGVLTIAGTGAVALTVTRSGEARLTDGAGWLLGDAGGGLQVGRAGLAAAVRWHDGRPDGSELLATAAQDRFGPLEHLAERVHGDAQPARLLAGFVPDVATAARAGDETARGIFIAATRELSTTTLTACAAVAETEPLRVCFAGGLFDLDDLVAAPVMAMVARAQPRAEICTPAGDAIDGVHRLVTDGSGRHQQLVQRLPALRQGTRSVVDPAGADHALLDGLPTEGRLPDAANLDQLTTAAQVALMAQQDRHAVDAVAAVGDDIGEVVDVVVDRLSGGGRLIYVGAGTSGRLAVMDAAECGPTFGIDPDRVVAVMAGGETSLGRAVEQGEDDGRAGRRDLAALQPAAGDVVIGLTASGRTPYVRQALRKARELAATTIAVVNTPASPLAAEAHHRIEVRTGAEIVSGSTRLKAGTAQKLVLNTISTVTFVRLGHTFGDLMVDVRATNDKLRRRALRIVVEATGVDEPTASAALEAADGAVKVAVAMLLGGYDAAEASEALAAAGGRLRDILDGS